MRRLRQEDHGAVPPQGPRPVLARGLSQVRLLRLPPGGGGIHALHEGQPHLVQEGLSQVSEGTKTRVAVFANKSDQNRKLNQVKSDYHKSDQVRSGYIRLNEIRSGQVKSSQLKLEQLVRSYQVESVRPGFTRIKSGQVRLP